MTLVLLKCPDILFLYCCFASLIPWDKLALAVARPAVSLSLKGGVNSNEKNYCKFLL